MGAVRYPKSYKSSVQSLGFGDEGSRFRAAA